MAEEIKLLPPGKREKRRVSPAVIIGIGAGAAIGIGTILYFLTRAKAPPPGGAILYGMVTDANTGYPIEGVRISLNGLVTHTDSNGAYAFVGVAPDAYTVEFSKEGYETLVY